MERTSINATILADSICHTRLTTFLLTFPRFILAELNTHRMLTRSSASSRAIPIARKIEQVSTNPAGPVWWGRNQSGMQASETLSGERVEQAQEAWRAASQAAIAFAWHLSEAECHKQHGNRVLEPFATHRCLVTGTEWANFFNLRCSEHAAPEFDALATLMLRAYLASEPTLLNPGEWHAPFGDRLPESTSTEDRLLVSAARCARISYETHDGEFSVEKDLELARRLLDSGHMSPFEHQAQAVNLEPRDWFVKNDHWLLNQGALWDGRSVWWGNLREWRQYRKTLPNENRTAFDALRLLAEAEARWSERGVAL